MEKQQKYIFTYVFKHDFKSTWNTLKDISKIHRMCNLVVENYIGKPIFTYLSDSFTSGSEFNLDCLSKNVKLYIKTMEVEEKPNYGYIKFRVYKVEPYFTPYYYSYKVNGDSSGNYSTMHFEIVYDEPLYKSREELEEENIFRLSMYKNIEECIAEEKRNKIQEESIIIYKNFEVVWRAVSNLKYLQSLVPNLCEIVEYNENEIYEGLTLTFKWEVKYKSTVFMKVILIINKSEEKKLILESLQSSPPVPHQEIEWNIINLGEDQCKVRFIHRYTEIVNKDTLMYIAESKNDILKTLKNKIESEVMI